MSVTDPLSAGRESLSRGEWEQARAHFEAALARDESAEAIEALAMAAWWLDDGPLAIESRERAYRLHRERGDVVAAARMATWLAWDYLAFRGESAVANGWLQRAHRLLDDVEPAPEHGWLAIREGEIAFLLENDIARARGLASAAAVAGEMSELWAVGRAGCYLITACERVRDFERASQWSERMLEFADRWRIPHLFAVCRAHYAAILVWRGTWAEAEAEFDAAMREFQGSRPGMGFEAVVRLAELRRRQGRLEEASALFGEVAFHPFAQLGLAAVALDGGDGARAAELAQRFLRQLGSQNRIQRVAGLELLVRALVAASKIDRARASLAELNELVAQVGTDSLRASALVAEGTVAEGEGDHERARQRFEDAVDLFQRIGAPFETARTRLELARALAALGRRDSAAEQERTAHAALRAMGAESATTSLTPREVEVLRLVAQGLSNPAIAEQLVLSEHTVHRHLANILGKLELSSRAAAAA